ncbi:MAG: hypothetical protein LBR36_01975 [Bacteroidales bacterium]|nr:hypothetical protein [Bacteroidales bacterium]
MTSPQRWKLTKEVYDFLGSEKCQISEEEKHVMRKFLARNIIHWINYPFVNEYMFRKVNVFYDNDLGLPYVLRDEKRLYFRKDTSPSNVASAYNYLCIEQDTRSPHSYWTFDIPFTKDDIAVDAGAAEGIWGLDIVENVKELYLFETEDKWIDALQATFAPWKDKVHIIKKFVSQKTDEKNVRLDDYFAEKGIYPSILKADVDGSEMVLTEGATNLLSTHLQHVILCTYHYENDYADLAEVMKKHGLKYCYSDGYMVTFYTLDGDFYSGDVSKIVRKGLIYGKR